MNEVLLGAFARAQDDDMVKVIVFGGVGSDFCSGEDTKHMPIESFGLKKNKRPGQSLRMRGIRKLLDSTLSGTWRLYTSIIVWSRPRTARHQSMK